MATATIRESAPTRRTSRCGCSSSSTTICAARRRRSGWRRASPSSTRDATSSHPRPLAPPAREPTARTTASREASPPNRRRRGSAEHVTAAISTTALRKVYKAPSQKRGQAAPGQGPPSGGYPGSAGPNGSGEIVALEGLDLEIAEGEFFGLLGPNGAGKSTTIGILTTRVRPTGGRAFVDGEDVVENAAAVRQRIGVVPQRPNPDRSLDVLENLVFHAAYFGIPKGEATSRAEALLRK